MKISIYAFTKKGARLMLRLSELLQKEETALYAPTAHCISPCIQSLEGLKERVAEDFATREALIFVGAAGIGVRSIAPHVKDKLKDPAVVVIDEGGNFVIPLLSGHAGGANALALQLASPLGGAAVITTATDLRGAFAIDVWAKKRGLKISDSKLAKEVSAGILEGKIPGFSSEIKELPKEELPLLSGIPSSQSVVVTNRIKKGDVLTLIPPNLVLGMGCKKGTAFSSLREFAADCLAEQGYDFRAVGKIASIDLKKEEMALVLLAKEWNVPFITFSREALQNARGSFTSSAFVQQITGVDNVCERSAALLSSRILIPKTSREGMALALGEYDWRCV